jgi:hypothetical protein
MKRLKTEKKLTSKHRWFEIPISGSLKERMIELEELKGFHGMVNFFEEFLYRMFKQYRNVENGHSKDSASSLQMDRGHDKFKMWKRVENHIRNDRRRYEFSNQVLEEMLREEGLVE